jgi:hypothetical protein
LRGKFGAEGVQNPSSNQQPRPEAPPHIVSVVFHPTRRNVLTAGEGGSKNKSCHEEKLIVSTAALFYPYRKTALRE